MNLKQAILYDSVYNGDRKNELLKPIHHLQCKIDMCESSKYLYTRAFSAKASHPSSLVCVLDEMPELKLSYSWKEGINTCAAGPLDNVLKYSIGTYLSMFAGKDYIAMPHTNEFSQFQLSEGSVIGMQLKFRVYADTFNQRYRFMTSTYESWLRFLSLAVMPLMPFSYKNMATNVDVAGENTIDTGANVIGAGVDAVKHLGGMISALASKTSSGGMKGEDAKAVLDDVKTITEQISTLLTQSTSFGHLVYKLEIPGYIRPSNSVPWIIKNFNAKPCAEFLRGTWPGQKSTGNTTNADFRPKPLYIDFTVDVETNQIVTREQLFSILATLDVKAIQAKAESDRNAEKSAQ